MANMLSFLNGDFDVAIGLHGFNAVRYTQIKKGTAFYTKGQTQLVHTKRAAEILNRPHKVLGVTLIHGETDDFINTRGNTYTGYLEELQSDYQSDIQATTGQTETIPLFTDQESSFTSNYYVNKATSEIPLAQLAAAVENPDEIILVTPKYFFPYDVGDGVHLPATSSRWLGEYYGKVIHEVSVEGNSWTPLMPLSVSLIENDIMIDYHVPKGHLVFDTDMVAERTDYGFEYYDEEGSTTISEVVIVDTDTIKITLSQIPLGTHKKIRYAYSGVRGVHADPQDPRAVGGNLRDTDDAPSLHGNPLYNWAVQGEWDVMPPPVLFSPVVISVPTSQNKSLSQRKKISPLVDIFGQKEDQAIGGTNNEPCLFITNNLKKGDYDGRYSYWESGVISDVAVLQTYLNKKGFNSGAVDGYIGPKTVSAIKAMQKSFGIVADGMVGRITKKLIHEQCVTKKLS
jgi:hypothetical protein